MTDEPAGGRRSWENRSAQVLRAGLLRSGLSQTELWISYLTLGGTLGEKELGTALNEGSALTPHEHDVIAQALNDHFIGQGQDHPVLYIDQLEKP